MPTFKYKALDAEGGKKKGLIEADSKSAAVAALQERRLLPVSVEASAPGASGRRRSPRLPARRVNLSESFYYLALMLRSGSSLAESLELMGRMAGGGPGRVWLEVRDKVESGQSFSDSLAEHPSSFPRIYIGMVKVAESVGRLAEVLEKISDYEEQRREFSGRILTALVYPAMILLVGAGAVYFLLARVLPNIASIFENARAELPASTEVLLAAGTWLRQAGPLLLLPPLAVVLLLVLAYRRRRPFRARVDGLLWRVPLLRKNILARFSGLLGFQLESGIPLVRAMENAREAVNSAYFRDIILNAAREVSGGRSLDKVLAETGAFPDVYILTLTTGQKAGSLGPFLSRMAGILERDVDNTLKRIMGLAEPALILVIGLVVGFIVISILTPIFDMSRLVG
jgi:general secretion pathway protein F/type IV pilus assembly protein PilC